MSHPLMAIGAAIVEVIGLSPTEVGRKGEGRWIGLDTFGGSPFFQPTGLGEQTLTLSLAARPHVTGGLDTVATLEMHRDNQDAVPVIRLTAGAFGIAPGGEFLGMYGVRRVEPTESVIAPSGRGHRLAVEVELVALGQAEGGFA